jgi:hypothetical protein
MFFASLRTTRKPIGSRSSSSEAYREDRFKILASFMMLCLNSIVVYGNAYQEDQSKPLTFLIQDQSLIYLKIEDFFNHS